MVEVQTKSQHETALLALKPQHAYKHFMIFRDGVLGQKTLSTPLNNTVGMDYLGIAMLTIFLIPLLYYLLF